MKLIYFKAPGRAESCRLMLGVRQKPFQDVHITRDQWPEAKKAMKFGQVPVLELEDGKQLVQVCHCWWCLWLAAASQHGIAHLRPQAPGENTARAKASLRKAECAAVTT